MGCGFAGGIRVQYSPVIPNCVLATDMQIIGDCKDAQ